MAVTPDEKPDRFVCTDCHVVSAGVPEGDGPPYDAYRAPDRCGACGGENLVAFGEFDRLYEQ